MTGSRVRVHGRWDKEGRSWWLRSKSCGRRALPESWGPPESDDILEAEGEDELAPDSPQRRRVERSEVFQKVVFGDRLT